MAERKKIERRTYSQDRFEILIKKQKNGRATFNDLTELDEIVNRVPDIRAKVLHEMEEAENPTNDSGQDEIVFIEPVKAPDWLERVKMLLGRLFNNLEIADLKISFLQG